MTSEINNSPETEHQTYMYDAIIVLGSGVQKKDSHSAAEPGFLGKMRVIAAAEAYIQGLTHTLVLCGGNTSGDELPSEAQAMRDYMDRKYTKSNGKFMKIPEEDIILEESSKDTSTNLENILQMIRERGWNKVAILTNDFHIKRATKLAGNFGLEVQDLSAEDELRERDPRFNQVIDNLYSSPDMEKTQRTEKILSLMLIFDPKARIPKFISSRTRK